MNEGTCKVISVVTTILFTIAALLGLVMGVTKSIESKIYQQIVFIIGFLLIIIVAVLLTVKFFRNNRFILFKFIFINLLTIVLFILLYSMIPNPVAPKYFGHNINVCSYHNSIFGKTYKDFDDAVSDWKPEKGMAEFYRFDGDKYAAVFYKDDEKVISYEFFKQDGRYYRYGSRNIVYDSDEWNSALSDREYTDEETMLADIEYSFNQSRMEWLNQSEQFPAFGVLPTPKIQNVDVNGKPIDMVIEIKNEQGKKWFFWFIKNSDVHEIDKIVINGI